MSIPAVLYDIDFVAEALAEADYILHNWQTASGKVCNYCDMTEESMKEALLAGWTGASIREGIAERLLTRQGFDVEELREAADNYFPSDAYPGELHDTAATQAQAVGWNGSEPNSRQWRDWWDRHWKEQDEREAAEQGDDSQLRRTVNRGDYHVSIHGYSFAMPGDIPDVCAETAEALVRAINHSANTHGLALRAACDDKGGISIDRGDGEAHAREVCGMSETPYIGTPEGKEAAKRLMVRLLERLEEPGLTRRDRFIVLREALSQAWDDGWEVGCEALSQAWDDGWEVGFKASETLAEVR